MAETLPPTAEGVKECAERLRAGKLVAFPTETVYGLGANALDEPAVRDIFTCKVCKYRHRAHGSGRHREGQRR